MLQQQYQTEIAAALRAGDYQQALKLFKEYGNPNLRALNEAQTLKAFGDYAAAMGYDVSPEAPGTDKTLAAFEEIYQNNTDRGEKQYGVLYGEKATNVDFDYIYSKEYQDKFFEITDNSIVNQAIYDISRNILSHCDGTEYEDMFLFNMMDGTIIAKQTESRIKLGIIYSDEFRAALEKIAYDGTPVIALHNHPHGTPPSADDFRKAYENKYAVGIIIGHNGLVYMYSNKSIEISKKTAEWIANDILFFCGQGYDVDRAYTEVYKYYGLSYLILKGERE
ncbi:MAG: hypothetical protein ACI3VA_10085 [Candidatus Limivicinus sp.]